MAQEEMINAELAAFAAKIAAVSMPEDLFGALGCEKAERIIALTRLYRRLARVAHADRYASAEDKAVAHGAFTRLSALHVLALERIKAGTYGSRTVATLRTKRGTYRLTDAKIAGDIAVLYKGSADGDADVLVKIPASVTVNDMMAAEASATKALAKSPEWTDGYYPKLLESFKVHYSDGDRIVNVFRRKAGYVPLTAVREAYPGGVDGRHFVWMCNRLLNALAFAHAIDLVHGAVLPSHVLVEPETHGMLLVGWGQSAKIGERVKTVSPSYRSWYPPEVLAGRSVSPATDIYMAAFCMAYVLGGSDGEVPSYAPTRFRAFLRACMIASPNRRPADAGALYSSFVEVAQREYGPRAFVKFTLDNHVTERAGA